MAIVVIAILLSPYYVAWDILKAKNLATEEACNYKVLYQECQDNLNMYRNAKIMSEYNNWRIFGMPIQDCVYPLGCTSGCECVEVSLSGE